MTSSAQKQPGHFKPRLAQRHVGDLGGFKFKQTKTIRFQKKIKSFFLFNERYDLIVSCVC